MDDALTDAIQRRFDLALHDVSRIEQGDEALVWRVETDQGRRIVHIGPAWRSSEELAWTHRVIRHAAAGAPQAIPPIPAPDGATFVRHYYPRNLLCRKGCLVAVIDWHEAETAPIAGEVAWAAGHDEQLRLLPDRAARFLQAYGVGAPSFPVAVSLMRVWLRENVRYGLALARPGQPADEHHLGLQLRAFVELGRLAA